MSKIALKDILGIINKVKSNQSSYEYFDSEINSIFSIVSNEIVDTKFEKSNFIKKIIDDKLNSINVTDKQSFYIGKLAGLSIVIAQVKHSLDFEEFALSLDDAELNTLLHLYNRREIVWEESQDNSESDNSIMNAEVILNKLEKNNLLINHKFSGMKFCTISSKGDNVMKILQKRNRLNLNSSEIIFFETENTIDINPRVNLEEEEFEFSEFFELDSFESSFEEDEK